MKVIPMETSKGNVAKNQYIILTENTMYFQSYDVIVGKIEAGKLYFDKYYYNYSNTTSKYLYKFMRKYGFTLNPKEGIKQGLYNLTNLN